MAENWLKLGNFKNILWSVLLFCIYFTQNSCTGNENKHLPERNKNKDLF